MEHPRGWLLEAGDRWLWEEMGYVLLFNITSPLAFLSVGQRSAFIGSVLVFRLVSLFKLIVRTTQGNVVHQSTSSSGKGGAGGVRQPTSLGEAAVTAVCIPKPRQEKAWLGVVFQRASDILKMVLLFCSILGVPDTP
jgi:hypothetical protein